MSYSYMMKCPFLFVFFTQVLLYCYTVTVSGTLMVIIAYNHVIKL